MSVANSKIGLNSEIFEILIRCRHARHPRRSPSFDRHRRPAYKTGWPSCRHRGIGTHSASTPHLESQWEASSQPARFRSHDRRFMHPSHAPSSHSAVRYCPKAFDAAAFSPRTDVTKVPHAVFVQAGRSAWSEGTGPRIDRCRRGNATT
jgi:hypothetical protein